MKCTLRAFIAFVFLSSVPALAQPSGLDSPLGSSEPALTILLKGNPGVR